MKRFWIPLVMASVCLAANPNVKRLEWTDPQGRQPLTYKAWAVAQPATLGATRIGTLSWPLDDSVVDVVVNAELYPSISAEIAQYQADLTTAGYSVQVDTMRGASAPALRAHLAGISQLIGAVLVGELPVAWYESLDEFPTDHYFMDLDGTWGDADADGLYDSHSGNTAPEIWVGRLYARPLTWDDEVGLMKRYFAKDHLYRTASLSLPDRGLSYVDDDWAGQGSCFLGLVYHDSTVVDNGPLTTAAYYRDLLQQGFEWIHLCAHSCPWGHTFRYFGGYAGTVSNTDIYAIRPHAHFYSLFACSGTRFVEENYSAGWDIFQDDYGLCAVGSTGTGSLLCWQGFYTPIALGKSIGEAFKTWLTDENNAECMNLMGDPTLRPHNNALGPLSGHDPKSPTDFGHVPDTSDVVCTDPETDDSPRLLAMPDGKVWAIWKSARSSVDGRFDIYASVRSGGTWSSPYNIGNAECWETDPALGLDRFYRPVAVWSLFTDQYYYNLVYSVWNGNSWSVPQTLSDDPSSDLKATLCRDANDTLWCFWYSRRDLDADIFASRFNGASWTTPVNLTNDTLEELYPVAAAMPNGHVWVAYTKYRNGVSEVWARHWNGSGWTETGPVSGTQKRALRPAITNVSNNPLVCWQSFDSGNGNICCSFFDGSNWGTPFAVDSDTGLDVHPALATDPWNSQYLCWMSTRNGNWDVYCARYMGGVGWTAPWPVATDTGPDINPDVAADSAGNISAAWQNLTAGNWDINADVWQTDGVAERPQADAQRLLVQPNPARGRVSLMLPQRSSSAVITDALGRRVRELRCTSVNDRTLVWDGRDNAGRQVAPGVYVVRVAGTDGSAGRKVLMVR